MSYEIELPTAPDFDGLIDEDILKRFENSSVFYGDIINAQLIKTNKLLIEAINKVDNETVSK
ncbi:MAG: hypothetical protein ABFS32_22440 [Bacteroidota bacterium]